MFKAFTIFTSFAALVDLVTIGARKIKKGCHVEALEACALGIVNYALAIMYSVKAFARMLRVPQHDTSHNICERISIFRAPMVTRPTTARNEAKCD